MAAMKLKINEEIRALQLESHVLELEMNGLTVVPPEVHGVAMDKFDEMVEVILAEAESMVGCPFTLERGPHSAIEYPEFGELNQYAKQSGRYPSQFLLQRLGSLHRVFRDLAINPVAVALMRHMLGSSTTRFSSSNAIVKWQGEFGYGPTLGMHADQGDMPVPWGRHALTANTNWCLTDYTRKGGAFVYVPGSNHLASQPVQPAATVKAVALEVPRGSALVFHGATWHGALPRTIPGMRLTVSNYYRYAMVKSQEDIQGTFSRELASDCENPALFHELAGFDDRYPYAVQNSPVPRAVESAGE